MTIYVVLGCPQTIQLADRPILRQPHREHHQEYCLAISLHGFSGLGFRSVSIDPPTLRDNWLLA